MRLGSWTHNEWSHSMVFHHEYIIAFYLGVSGMRHLTFLIDPKLIFFYVVMLLSGLAIDVRDGVERLFSWPEILISAENTQNNSFRQTSIRLFVQQ